VNVPMILFVLDVLFALEICTSFGSWNYDQRRIRKDFLWFWYDLSTEWKVSSRSWRK
jgi:hypothetical protein